MKFSVIYLWRGERHRSIGDYSLRDANKLARTMQRDGWQAWVEPVGGAR